MYRNIMIRTYPPEPGLSDYRTDKALTLKAKGLLSVIIEDYFLEENHRAVLCWTVTRATRTCRESRQGIYNIIEELKTQGYIDKIGKKVVVRTYRKPQFMKAIEEDPDNITFDDIIKEAEA